MHKNATSYFAQILEATPHETTAVRPLASYLKNYPSKTNKTCGTLLKKQGQTSMDPYTRTYQSSSTGKDLVTSAPFGHRM